MDINDPICPECKCELCECADFDDVVLEAPAACSLDDEGCAACQ